MKLLEWSRELRLFSRIMLLGFIPVYLITLLGLFRGELQNADRAAMIRDGAIGSYLMIDSGGRLVGWGRNENWLIGGGTWPFYSYARKRVILKDAAAVYTNGRKCAMAIDRDGTLLGWGKHGDLLGMDSDPPGNEPVRIMEDVSSAAVGDFHAAAIKKDGSLWTWGQNISGQLGIGPCGDGHTIKEPVKVMENMAAVGALYDTTWAISRDGGLYLWGGQGESRPVLAAHDVRELDILSPYDLLLTLTSGERQILDLSRVPEAGTYGAAALSPTVMERPAGETAVTSLQNFSVIRELLGMAVALWIGAYVLGNRNADQSSHE